MVVVQLNAAKAALSRAIRSSGRSLISATSNSGRQSRSLSVISLPSTTQHNNHNQYHHQHTKQWTNSNNYQSIAHFSSIPDAEVIEKDDKPPPPPKDELEFQAETKQLLDIVTHSLYTDKEVFLRELVSNASDALEKLRHVQATGTLSGSTEDGSDLEIRITTDEASNTLTITDTGIGMSKEEMVNNLGTIARSGSKAFINEMNLKKQGADDTPEDRFGQGIIGRFGVGFYSGFMVADKVDVRSKSAGKISDDNNSIAESDNDDEAIVWESDGTGKYSISQLDSDIRQDRGTSVVLHLKPELAQYANESTIETILKKYSNFVGFPIFLNGKFVCVLCSIVLCISCAHKFCAHFMHIFFTHILSLVPALISTQVIESIPLTQSGCKIPKL